MKSVEQTIENIKLLIAGGDLSDTPQLRQFHAAALSVFKELNEKLEQCRSLVENGSTREARQLNCSFEPSLTRVAEYLEFFKENDFLQLCKDYGLEMPVFPDEKLVNLLSMPVSSGEKHLHVLLQDYRKIARSGSKQQRIALLREIVSKLPNSERWRRDLVSAERSRQQEMEQEIEEALAQKDAREKLEQLYREALAPEWEIAPKPELLEKIRRKLLPLQQAALEREVEEKLQILQDCWMERDYARLEGEMEKWNTFAANPMLRLTPDQQQALADIRGILAEHAEEEKQEQACRELVRSIERKLADNAPFSAVAGEYNRLQLQEYQIPAALLNRLQSMEEESGRYEYLRTVRGIICGICGAVLLVAAVVFAVFYTQHALAVKNNCKNMAELLKEKKYDELVKLYGELKKSSPKVAADPKVIFIYNAAVSEEKENAQRLLLAQEKFSRLLKQIGNLSGVDILDNSKALDRAIAEARATAAAHPLKKELLDEFQRLETAVASRRTKQKQEMERRFEEFCRKGIGRLEKLTLSLQKKSLSHAGVEFAMLEKDFMEKLTGFSTVPEAMKTRGKKDWHAAADRFKAALKKEKALLTVTAPATFENYAAGLEKLRYEYPGEALAYGKAFRNLKVWQRECETYRQFIPADLEQAVSAEQVAEGMLRKDLKQFLPRQQRSSEFAAFFSALRKQKDLKEFCFTTSKGEDFFFYVPGMVRVEKLRRPARTNISFTAEAVPGKEKRFVIVYSSSSKAPFVFKSGHKDLPYPFPGAFAQAGGSEKLTPQSFSTKWPGSAIGERFSALEKDGPGLFINLQAALKYVLKEGGIRNGYLKEMLVNALLQEIGNVSKLYPEAGEMLKKLREFRAGHRGDWRSPQASGKYRSDLEQLQQLWSELDIDRILAAGKLRGEFICAFHNRRLIPAGIIQSIGGGKIKIHFFSGIKVPRELLVLENDSLAIIPEALLKGYAPLAGDWKKSLVRGQLVWYFGDGRTTADFLREWREKSLRLNVPLQIRPAILPAGSTL